MRKKVIKKTAFRCVGPTTTPQKIHELQKNLQGNKTLDKSIGLYDILAGELRSQILYLLSREDWLCVCDLADILATSVSAVSHQLQVLRQAGLVRYRKQKKVVLYTLGFNLPEAAKLLFEKKKELKYTQNN